MTEVKSTEELISQSHSSAASIKHDKWRLTEIYLNCLLTEERIKADMTIGISPANLSLLNGYQQK